MSYISSLTPRPHRLTPPGEHPSRAKEAAKLLAWILSSWLRPADAEAEWQQHASA